MCGLGGGKGTAPHLQACDSEQLFWVVWFRGLELLKAKGRHRPSGVSAEVNLQKGKPTCTSLSSCFCGTTERRALFSFPWFWAFFFTLFESFFKNVTLWFLANSF